MKEIVGKCNTKFSTLPTKITVNKTDIFDAAKIADEFNKFLTNIRTDLTNKIPNASKPFDSYITKANTGMESQPLSINELKDVFFSLKINKSPGHDGVSFNIKKKSFGELCEPLKYLFNLSIVKRIFPDDLKIAKVTPIYKAGNSSNVSNYRQIPVLPCFSKMLERIMYNCLQKYLKDQNILYDKQFGFQTGHSTDHTIALLVDQIYEAFEKNEYTLGVFIDLSKAFDTVDHSILLRKLELYGITGRNYAWIKSYLSNRLQYIQVDENCRTEYCVVKCGVPQGSILGPLVFLLYVNDLKDAFSVLDPTMFVDDTNLFYTHSYIQKLFSMMNEELASINQWFTSNKLSLDGKKTKYSCFHKPSKKADIPVMLPKLTISNHVIERQEFIKFLGILLDENLNWKEHIKHTENKIAKNLGLLYKARPFLERNALLSLHCSYIETYINYANIAWGSTCRTNLKN